MANSRFPTGPASARNSRGFPRTTQRGSGYIEMMVDPQSLARLAVAFDQIEPKVREKIARDALRKWGRTVVKAARSFAYPGAVRTKRQLFTKIKRYKHVLWCGVGVRSEKVRYSKPEQRLGRKSPLVGWKSHFMEVGWHAFPRGVSGTQEWLRERNRNKGILAGSYTTRTITVFRNGKPHQRRIRERIRTLATEENGGPGKGWRRGIRQRKGRFMAEYATHYLFKAAQVGRANAKTMIVDSLNDAIRDVARTA